jgi:hypothetical protein
MAEVMTFPSYKADIDDTLQATKELFQGRFAKIAPDALRTWIKLASPPSNPPSMNV